jgi:potassium/hydrogen antiporter
LIIQVIVLTALIMMFGLIFNKQDDDTIEKKDDENLTIDIDVPL